MIYRFDWVYCEDLILKIDVEQQKILNKAVDKNQLYVNALQNRKLRIQSYYDTYGCVSKVEKLRLGERGALLAQSAIIQENLVAKKSNTDQQIYIGVGALVAVTGLYMILKK